jgi:hypothetical protein
MRLVAVQHFEFYARENEKQDFFVALQQFRVDFLKLRTITYARFLCRSLRFAPARGAPLSHAQVQPFARTLRARIAWLADASRPARQ